MKNTLASTIRADIQTRFADGKTFSAMDFKIYANHGTRGLSQILECLSRDTQRNKCFIRKCGKFDSKIPGCPPMNRYQIASADISSGHVEIDDKPGTVTIWHPMKTPPHHNGMYQIKRIGSDKIEKIIWLRGWKTNVCFLPSAYVEFWRGVTR
ncbi:hypothetical protein UFOVP1155_10 [uncultured Caudovirales phage]|uniref:Uncharacterized protein n=1 Tax=uncultured Caudovirales phage TaxID=2100421 RepID=A0A6J5R304_9CAUD|nr:hypothetical protein UFOVP1155_10 [uncultured Caudovirales phage]